MPLSKNDLETYVPRYAECGRFIRCLARTLLDLPDPMDAERIDLQSVQELADVLKIAVRLAKATRPRPRRVY